jgi:hypothetical protein
MNTANLKQIGQAATLALICALGLALRLIQLGTPVWGDETGSWVIARRSPFIAMLRLSSNDPTPPLYYALLHFSIPLLGETPSALRLPSVLFSTLIIPTVYWGVRRAFTHRDGCYAALLAASASVLIYYAQEARAYALLALLGALAVILLAHCLAGGYQVTYWLYAATLVLLAFTHRYGLFLIAAQMICLIRYRRWKTVLIPLFAMIASLAPLLIVLIQSTYKTFFYGAAGDRTTIMSIESLLVTLGAGTVGMQWYDKLPHPQLLSYPHPTINQSLILAGIAVCCAVAILAPIAARRFTPTQRQLAFVIWVCLIVPAGLALLSGSPLLSRPQWLLRGLVFLTPLFCMALVIACANPWLKRSLVALFILLNAGSLDPYYTIYTRFDDSAAFTQLGRRTTSDDLIISDPWFMHGFIRYYYRGPAPLIAYEDGKGWVDIEKMQQNNLYYTYPLAAPPAPRGNVYVFFRRAQLPWAGQFPHHTIYTYDPTKKSWRKYTGR